MKKNKRSNQKKTEDLLNLTAVPSAKIKEKQNYKTKD